MHNCIYFHLLSFEAYIQTCVFIKLKEAFSPKVSTAKMLHCGKNFMNPSPFQLNSRSQQLWLEGIMRPLKFQSDSIPTPRKRYPWRLDIASNFLLIWWKATGGNTNNFPSFWCQQSFNRLLQVHGVTNRNAYAIMKINRVSTSRVNNLITLCYHSLLYRQKFWYLHLTMIV